MTDPQRKLKRAARKYADQDSSRLARLPLNRVFLTTVANVNVGAATAGTDLVTILWRGAEVDTDGYFRSYSPRATGDRVACVVIDNQLIVIDAINGQPI